MAPGPPNSPAKWSVLRVKRATSSGSSRQGATRPPSGLSCGPSRRRSVLGTIRHRVQRLLVRRGLEPGDEAGPADRLVEESAVLAGVVGASGQGRVARG